MPKANRYDRTNVGVTTPASIGYPAAVLTLLLLACGPTSSISLNGNDTGEGAGEETGATVDDSGSELPGDSSDTDSGEDTGDNEDKDAIYEAFFDPAVIQTIDITLDDSAIRSLNRDGGEYVEGGVVINGQDFPSVGIRLKGSSTYEDLECNDGYCKASFKIKTDEYVLDQKYGSLQRITLNNMTTDYTQSKEIIVYDLLHQHSQLASRASYARVTLNGEPWGLYANIESIDDEWVERRFSDDSGNLWGTGTSYGDFTDSGMRGGWVNKSGAGDLEQIARVKTALDSFGGDFFGELGPLVNVDQFLDYWAWCAAVGNFDGYPFHLNDVIMYEDPADERRLTFAPWGTDESWDQLEVSGQAWYTIGGRLALACYYDAACLAELKVHIDTATTEYGDTDVLAMAQAAWDLSEADVQTDPVRPFTPDYVWSYRDYYEPIIEDYDEYVRAQVGL
ncbi:hypothetical protein LBMAG42_36610 [Deltaproteobacteria bacterium]|nr:hypothetical protein LBMAG42_36610 [Deltaproteobacteria bacterium]